MVVVALESLLYFPLNLAYANIITFVSANINLHDNNSINICQINLIKLVN